MSRTRRRKRTPEWVLNPCYWKLNGRVVGFRDDFPSWTQHNKASDNDLKCIKNKYHSDAYDDINAPKWFRQERNRNYRAKMNHETSRILKQGDYSDYSYKRYVKDVNWLWW